MKEKEKLLPRKDKDMNLELFCKLQKRPSGKQKKPNKKLNREQIWRQRDSRHNFKIKIELQQEDAESVVATNTTTILIEL